MVYSLRIRNPHQINPIHQSTQINLIRPPHRLHQLAKGIVNLHFGSFNTSNNNPVPCRIGINANAFCLFFDPIIRTFNINIVNANGGLSCFKTLPKEMTNGDIDILTSI